MVRIVDGKTYYSEKVIKEDAWNFVSIELAALNREILDAAADGDVIRKDIIDTKIETLEEFIEYIERWYGEFVSIREKEVWCDTIQWDGIGSYKQYYLVKNGVCFYPLNPGKEVEEEEAV